MINLNSILATFPEWGAESVPNKNASNQWLEAVDEEEYLKLKLNKTIRKGYLIVVYFKSYFEGSLEILGITLGKKKL